MRDLTINASPHMSRHYRSETHWYIPHEAGQFKITLTKIAPIAIKYVPNATYYEGTSKRTAITVANEEEFATISAEKTLYYEPNEINVQWVLPNGQVVEGMSIDTEVEQGTTLCICSDFYACGLDVDCDILLVDNRDLPPFQGSIHLKTNVPRSLADYAKKETIMGSTRTFVSGILSIKGSAANPSKTYGTTKDISNLLHTILGKIEIAYAPNITGDLKELKEHAPAVIYNIWDTSTGAREYHPHYANSSSSEIVREAAPTIISFHHCGVHGVPSISTSNQIFDWEYYACPNASAQDYDDFLDKLMTQHIGSSSSSSAVGFVSGSLCAAYCYEVGKPVVPAYGTLKISNRTTNPTKRAEKLNILRSAGWQIEEIDDSLEDGIYATI